MNAHGIGAVADPNEDHQRLRSEIEKLATDQLTTAGVSAYIALEAASALCHAYLTHQNWTALRILASISPQATRKVVLLRQMAKPAPDTSDG